MQQSRYCLGGQFIRAVRLLKHGRLACPMNPFASCLPDESFITFACSGVLLVLDPGTPKPQRQPTSCLKWQVSFSCRVILCTLKEPRALRIGHVDVGGKLVDIKTLHGYVISPKPNRRLGKLRGLWPEAFESGPERAPWLSWRAAKLSSCLGA